MCGKTCFKCGLIKPIDEFYKHPRMKDGVLGKCKDCTKNDVKTNYACKREQYSNYEKHRSKDPLRKKKSLEYQKKRRTLDPQKYAARNAVCNAVRDNRIQRTPCVICGSNKVQAHHHDYSKPLDVEWLCFRCHRTHRHGQRVS